MARSSRGRRRLASRQYRSNPYPLPSCQREVREKEINQKQKGCNVLEKKDWEDATCSVCMEYPHNAVLLLCSSHDKGCRPYMCGTSYRYSNCLDQFKKAYTKVMSPPHGQAWHGSTNHTVGLNPDWPNEKSEVVELSCPLCRGQVKGWTVVEAAREYLNNKKRSCMQDNCSFIGTYKELRKHVRAVHPSARPREVDPILEQKWRRLERERERDDVISTIRSSMPGAMVLGDYVIEGNHYGFDTDDGDADEDDGNYGLHYNDNLFNFVFFLRHQAGDGVSFSTRLRRLDRGLHRSLDEDGRGGIPHVTAGGSSISTTDGNDDDLPVDRRRRRVVELGRSERRLNRRNRRRAVIDIT
ncbi:PREDICTED: uncharacterized protein LOC104589337 [Nelumbo nucifera]|uniref:Uncharacterized protein LOC104589337 n=2 Tax=Nelumbo nucifera TaxID=4432 RepID=A0A1U7Z1J9_NELNU|nr:PREDICTED: uncharacterized protein LOC104589337 [Nelumbo nucifera]XP_010245923.1 PREDICTED: uncharacterized protein LOC104589337 [Nelumbo nucifera]DAD39483.1 TPA_asm: hypothetical protein HUJ06_013806 [Nelumbo nucifera]